MTLTPLRSADWPAVHSWASLPEVCRHQAWGPNSEAQSREFVRRAVEARAADPQVRYPYLVRLGEQAGDPVGMAEVHVRSRAHRQGEITYALHPRAWGRGVGTATARALLTVAFGELGLHRVQATCDPRNLGSARVLAKAGLREEGLLRHTALLRDGWRDSLVFGLLAEEFGPTGLGGPAGQDLADC
ncbi:GNAT family N-acetyltransferase [Kitasatospora sp. MMS16-BH015]|uniref:GNAT family N-acetyltransferase n=1 Tax=Kitasatospora sp. MMS16-BH015 TaxID=2018025 RepID=UPI0020C35448|nr:GNAT family N-acetyltransferase [Kitasatospora sp. MMS16-BH015]